MTLDAATLNYILSIAALFGIAFSIYKSYNNPQKKLEKKQALDEKDLESKSTILAKQLEWEQKNNAEKFTQLNEALILVNKTSQNDIAHLDSKISILTDNVTNMNLTLTNKITELATIINERIPIKKTK